MNEPPKPSVRANVARLVRQQTAAWADVPGMDDLNNLLRLMAKWRAHALAETYLAHAGATVMQGPFAGMTYLSNATEGALIARLLGAEVFAYDTSPVARAACADLATKNGVAGQVKIGGEFKPEDFQAFAGRRVLVLVDAEGAEVDILQPDRALRNHPRHPADRSGREDLRAAWVAERPRASGPASGDLGMARAPHPLADHAAEARVTRRDV